MKQFMGTPFSIKVETADNGPGRWESNKVLIYKSTLDNNQLLIGEYIRNYGHGLKTFYPFKFNNQWYALYSKCYTALRVLKLNEENIEDWCGQENDAYGFCPVELYVPQYHLFKTPHYDYKTFDNEYEGKEEEYLNEVNDEEYKETLYCPFGFVSGCVWGDDSSWKIRFIDLSKIEDQQLIITEKFGYLELPDGLKLSKCIDMRCWGDNDQTIKIASSKFYDL